MPPDAWIFITIAAAFMQNVRSYLQKRLADDSTIHGGAYVRFLYALPFAAFYALAVVEDPVSAVAHPKFWIYCAAGAISQIIATAMLLASFKGGKFGVGTVLSKTEAAQAGLFGLLILGEAVSLSAIAGIAISFSGVFLLSGRLRLDQLKGRTTAYGIAAGSFFGIAAVGYRGAALSTAIDSPVQAAAITLVIALSIQTLVYGFYLAMREPVSIRIAIKYWRIGLPIGMSGMAASVGWFTAMAMVSAALVRALGQVELLFTIATSAWLLREGIGRREILGAVLVGGGLILVALGPNG